MQLNHITKLHLGNKYPSHHIHEGNSSNVSGFTFYEGVAPVLTVIGKTLKKLILEDFRQADIIFIGQTCPNLEHLALSSIVSFAPLLSSHQHNSGTTNAKIPAAKLFRKLSRIELWQEAPQPITEPLLRSILCTGSPISHVIFQRCCCDIK